MAERRLLRWLVLALALVVGAMAATTPASAVAYGYDSTAVARAHAQDFTAAVDSPMLLRGTPGWSAPPSVEAQDASTTSVARSVATEAEAVAVNGETAATRYGRLMHQTYDYGPGFEREFTLESGSRVDAINFETREVIELKPNNPRAIRLGNQQLDRYLAELEKMFPGDPWTGKVVTYDRP